MGRLLLLSLLLLLGLAPLRADEHRDRLIFADNELAKPLFNSHHGRLYIYFSHRCPKTRRLMEGPVKEIADLIAETKAPVDLVLISGVLSPKKVVKYAKKAGIENVICAQDPNNTMNISLRNIFQSYLGRYEGAHYIHRNKVLAILRSKKDFDALGRYNYSPAGIEDPKLKELWWALENGDAKARASLAKMYKRAKPGKGSGDQVIVLYKEVAGAIDSAIEEAVAGEVSMESCEALEAALANAKGFKKYKEATDRLRSLKKEKAIKLEYKVKKIYEQTYKLVCASKKKEREKGRATMKALAAKYPDTLYGAKAASL